MKIGSARDRVGSDQFCFEPMQVGLISGRGLKDRRLNLDEPRRFEMRP